MHIVIGLITAIAGLLWALNSLQRSGFNIASFNPFAAWRRMQWNRKIGAGPLGNIDDPRELAAVLLTAVGKCEGEVSTAQKNEIMRLLIVELSFTQDEAADLMVAAAFLTRDSVYLVDEVDRVLKPVAGRVSPSQAESLIEMMRAIADIDSPANTEQRKLIDRTTTLLVT